MIEIDGQEQKRHLLEFRLGSSYLGCELDYVSEILHIGSIPNETVFTDPALTMNWRDEEIPLLDLRENLRGGPTERKVYTIVVVESNGLRAGIRVEEVLGIRVMDDSKLRGLPSLTRKGQGCFSKVLITDDHLTLILDLGPFLKMALENAQSSIDSFENRKKL